MMQSESCDGALQACEVAVARSEGQSLELASSCPEKYPPASFPADPSIEVDVTKHGWASYVLAAYKVRNVLHNTCYGKHDHIICTVHVK